MKETTTPFGASDSELMEATYFIPQGYHAVIDGNKVIIKKGEEPISNDLEEFAKRESELFAEREYEIGFIDKSALAKGYYWGVKEGAQWQKQMTIDKAVDYIANNMRCDGYTLQTKAKFIKDFKKAMEE